MEFLPMSSYIEVSNLQKWSSLFSPCW